MNFLLYFEYFRQPESRFRRTVVLITLLFLWTTVAIAHLLPSTILLAESIISAFALGYIFYNGSIRHDLWTSFYLVVLAVETGAVGAFYGEAAIMFSAKSLLGGIIVGSISYAIFLILGIFRKDE